MKIGYELSLRSYDASLTTFFTSLLFLYRASGIIGISLSFQDYLKSTPAIEFGLLYKMEENNLVCVIDSFISKV